MKYVTYEFINTKSTEQFIHFSLKTKESTYAATTLTWNFEENSYKFRQLSVMNILMFPCLPDMESQAVKKLKIGIERLDAENDWQIEEWLVWYM